MACSREGYTLADGTTERESAGTTAAGLRAMLSSVGGCREIVIEAAARVVRGWGGAHLS